MNDYPNTWSTQGTTSSFNNYTLNTKWSHQNTANQSGGGAHTNPSTLTTTFPVISHRVKFIIIILFLLRFCDVIKLINKRLIIHQK